MASAKLHFLRLDIIRKTGKTFLALPFTHTICTWFVHGIDKPNRIGYTAYRVGKVVCNFAGTPGDKLPAGSFSTNFFFNNYKKLFISPLIPDEFCWSLSRNPFPLGICPLLPETFEALPNNIPANSSKWVFNLDFPAKICYLSYRTMLVSPTGNWSLLRESQCLVLFSYRLCRNHRIGNEFSHHFLIFLSYNYYWQLFRFVINCH